MAHLWCRDTDRNWAVLELSGDRLHLDADLPGPAEDTGATGARLVRSGGADDGAWVLLTEEPGAVRVNGFPLPLGIRVLADRDAIRLGRLGTVFYSTEKLARIVEFPGAAEETRCARCRSRVEKGTPAVACPNCELWYHEVEGDGTDARPCWTYAETCAFCAQKTRLDAGFRWSPEGA